MITLSLESTIHTTVDALSHAVEGMLSVKSSMISDALAIESIRLLIDLFPILIEAREEKSTEKISVEVREKLLQAATMAGMVIAQTGTTVVHAMGYSLTYFDGIDHGRANGLLLGSYLQYVEVRMPKMTKRLLHALSMDSFKPLDAIMRQLLDTMELPSEKMLNMYAEKVVKTGNMKNCIIEPTASEIVELYTISLTQ